MVNMNLFQIKNSFVLTIFGASGDLAKLKLFPALYSLASQNRFPKNFYIIGYARSPQSRKQFQKDFEISIKKVHPKANKKTLKQLTDSLYYFQGQYNKKDDFERLHDFRGLDGMAG